MARRDNHEDVGGSRVPGMAYGVAYQGSESMKDAALAIGAPVPMADKLWDSKVFETPTPWEHGTGVPVVTSYLDCPDQLRPFIPRGQGAPQGLTLEEHVSWSKLQTHPDLTKMEDMEVDDDLRVAVKFESEQTAEEIDIFGEQMLEDMLITIMKMGDRRLEWWQESPEEIKQVTMGLHGSAMSYLETLAGGLA